MVKKPKKPTKKIQVKDLDAKNNPKGGAGKIESLDMGGVKFLGNTIGSR
jgi:hypothetical protein